MSSPSDPTESALKPGDTLVGRYRLVRLLGEGGMGWVWEGRHLTTDKPVAIKALKGETEADVARLLREARLSASLSHRNIVQVFDFWEPEGTGPVFMVMELLQGETLGAYLARAKRLGVEETRTVGVAVAAAMRVAHARGIVHRDLKPDNVFLVRGENDGRPEIKVLDFGIARPTIVDTQLTSITRTGSVIGTPHYMAPEQIYAEKDIDGRADVWALGVILYECLAGIKPFDGDNFGQVFRKVTHRDVRPLSEVAPSVPPAMAALVMSMLVLEWKSRPTSANVHDALEALAGGAGGARVEASVMETQWLPPPAHPSGGHFASPSPSPSPTHSPSRSSWGSGGMGTHQVLVVAPSVALPPSTTSAALAPSKTRNITAVVASIAAVATVAAIGLALASRTSGRSGAPVDLGPVVVTPPAPSVAAARPLPAAGSAPLPVEAPAASSKVEVANLPDGAAAPVANRPAAKAVAAATGSPRSSSSAPKPAVTPRPTATDPLGGGRF